MRLFMTYSWPGNVRELENIVKRIELLGSEEWVAQELTSRPMQPQDVGLAPAYPRGPQPAIHAPLAALEEGLTLKDIARRAALEAERAALKTVLDLVHWNRLEAARRLKVSYKTLRRKIRECGLRD
jgi:DNA-binding NtrC family response regulator